MAQSTMIVPTTYARRAYNPSDWYWIVGGDETQVYSSKRGAFVLVSDADYLEWLLPRSGETITPRPTQIVSSSELAEVLLKNGLQAIGLSYTRSSFLSSELFSILTDEDVANIILAIDAEKDQAKADKAQNKKPEAPLSHLWNSLQAQGLAPMEMSSPRVQAGIAALGNVLGAQRLGEIRSALKI